MKYSVTVTRYVVNFRYNSSYLYLVYYESRTVLTCSFSSQCFSAASAAALAVMAAARAADLLCGVGVPTLACHASALRCADIGQGLGLNHRNIARKRKVTPWTALLRVQFEHSTFQRKALLKTIHITHTDATASLCHSPSPRLHYRDTGGLDSSLLRM